MNPLLAEQFETLRRIADRGLRHAENKLDSAQVDLWAHLLTEIAATKRAAETPNA